MSLTGIARERTAEDAFALAVQRKTYTEIGAILGIRRQLASTLVKEQQERQWQGRDLSDLNEEKRRAIETYEAVIRAGWERLQRTGDQSLNVSGIFNSIISAQKAIDDVTGTKAPVKTENKTQIEISDERRRAMRESLDELAERRRRMAGHASTG
jgi:hypothetical protein